MTRVAAVDCGTNSTRLLIADHDGSPLVHRLEITRLGEGVHHSRVLIPAAIDRTIKVLVEYRRLIDDNAVDVVRAVTTSAARDAGNTSEFLEAAEAALGEPLELISGDEEGRLTFSGATLGLPPGPYLVLDIGGGSTELVLGRDGQVVDLRSVDAGSVRVTEQFLRSDPYRPEELADAFAAVDEWMTNVDSALTVAATRPALVGVAGTITSLAAIDLGLTSWDPARVHHHVLTREGLEAVFRSYSMSTAAERVADPLLPPGRADIIVGGLIVLLGVMRHWGFEKCRVSVSDLLDGIVRDARTHHRDDRFRA